MANAETGGYPYATYYGPGSNPATYTWTDASGSEWSPYGYGYRNCTDYVAWKLHSLGVAASKIDGLGNGGQWAANAQNRPSVTVNQTPAYGAAAVNTTAAPPYGHVSFVEAVHSNGTITISEYNYGTSGNYGTRTGTPSALGISSFVHFGVVDQASGTELGLVTANNTGFYKPDTPSPWQQQTGVGDAQAIAIGAGRLAVINGCGAMLAKPTMNSGFVALTSCGDAKQITIDPLTGGLGVITANGTALYKPDISSPWQQQTGFGDAKAIAMGAGKFALINSCGAMLVKATITSGFDALTSCGDAKAIAVDASSGALGVITANGTALYKANNSTAWTPQTGIGTNTLSITMGGGRFGVIVNCGGGSGQLLVKPAITSAFAVQTGCGDARTALLGSSATGSLVIVSGCGAMLVKPTLASGFNTLTSCGDARVIAVG